jgi:CRISPR type IV-associated protein Csf3
MRAKVTFNLHPEFVIIENYTTLDSILSGVIFKSQYAKDSDFHKAVAMSEKLPMEKIFLSDREWFYKASHPQFKIRDFKPIKFFKSTTTGRHLSKHGYNVTKILVEKNTLDQGSGPYRQFDFTLDVVNTDSVSFIADFIFYSLRDIKNYLKSLNITHIGKKSSLGFGRVDEIMAEETDEPIIRHVPLGVGNLECKQPYMSSRIRPPYWLKSGGYVCGIAKF